MLIAKSVSDADTYDSEVTAVLTVTKITVLEYLTLILLQERSGNSSFTHDALTLKYKLDNEFELVFVVREFEILATGHNYF